MTGPEHPVSRHQCQGPNGPGRTCPPGAFPARISRGLERDRLTRQRRELTPTSSPILIATITVTVTVTVAVGAGGALFSAADATASRSGSVS